MLRVARLALARRERRGEGRIALGDALGSPLPLAAQLCEVRAQRRAGRGARERGAGIDPARRGVIDRGREVIAMCGLRGALAALARDRGIEIALLALQLGELARVAVDVRLPREHLRLRVARRLGRGLGFGARRAGGFERRARRGFALGRERRRGRRARIIDEHELAELREPLAPRVERRARGRGRGVAVARQPRALARALRSARREPGKRRARRVERRAGFAEPQLGLADDVRERAATRATGAPRRRTAGTARRRPARRARARIRTRGAARRPRECAPRAARSRGLRFARDGGRGGVGGIVRVELRELGLELATRAHRIARTGRDRDEPVDLFAAVDAPRPRAGAAASSVTPRRSRKLAARPRASACGRDRVAVRELRLSVRHAHRSARRDRRVLRERASRRGDRVVGGRELREPGVELRPSRDLRRERRRARRATPHLRPRH